MSVPPTLPSDRQLIDAARTGHEAAWTELLARHESAIRAVLSNRSRSSRREIARSLDRLHDEVRAGPADDPGEGAQSVRAFRPRAIATATSGRYGPDPETGTADERLLAVAFARLPEPWQTVLWHTHVEQLSAAEVSPLVGRTVNEVTELLSTAERGLTDAFLFEYTDQADLDAGSATLVSLLGGYVRGALAPHEERLVDDHLSSVGSPAGIGGGTAAHTGRADEGRPRVHAGIDSRRLIATASSLPTALPPAIAPRITELSVDELRRALGTTTRSFGADTMVATRSNRVRRAVVVGSIAVIALALVGVGWLVQQGGSGLADPLPTIDPTPSIAEVEGEPVDPILTTVAADPEATTTTELDLRPVGPGNEIELNVTDGLDSADPSELRTAIVTRVDAPAPIFAGGTGTLDLAFENDTPDDVVATVEMDVPRGVVFDALADGAAECTDPDDDSPFCDIEVEAGSTLDLSMRFTLESSVVGRLVVDGATVDEPFEAQIDATADVVHVSVGRGDVVVAGNTAMTCAVDEAAQEGISCDEVLDGTSRIVDRWDVPIEFGGANPDLGLDNGSAAVLELPDSSDVLSAHLFWAGDLEVDDVAISGDEQGRVTIARPDGSTSTVEADEIVFGEENASQFFGRADVTDLVSGGGRGEYTVGNLTSVEAQGSFAAWTLVVVTDDDTLPRRQRVVIDPFDWVAPEAPYDYDADLPVPVVTGSSAGFDVIAFEGERGFVPETLTVAGTPLGGDNPFDSTIVGDRTPSFDNNLGVDIDAYDLIIDTPDGILPIEARSDDDGFRIAVIGLTVDLDT